MSEPRLSIIPGWIITDPRLKGKDLQVLCMLGRNANTRHGWCRRSQVKLAAALGCARSTVQAAIDRLVEIGAVERREVVSSSGRDSAHWYRVIYDSEVPSDAFNAWDEEDGEEFDPIDPHEIPAPPAGISAPPAGPGSAPPAGSGPAPINASPLTPPVEREERARAAEAIEEGKESPGAIERAFKKFFVGWKTAVNDSEPDARREWWQLSPDERREALDGSEAYQVAALSTGRKYLCSAAKYLKEKRWTKLEAQAAPTASPEPYTAYSRAGRGLLLTELLRPMRPIQLNAIEERIIAADPDKTEMIWRDKREKQGWPEAVRLIEATMQRKRFHVPPHIVSLAKDFDKVKVDGPIWHAWRELHRRRCWPWLPAPDGLEWMQFPRLLRDFETLEDVEEAVEEALRAFETRLREGKGDDDAA
ncbi:DNA-binding Lrp family transcriptional regulator [Neorhizobium galegae]|uniref:helix-turn-helix domain-containing protein n=1 Tax=Neorhizobium galegae TaxID=399 RepID=UPI001AE48BAA|nr:helix-turn-helix domain-containing protein [Neorhizobium galegae]MBP2560833.1 DNA-binding Lrp family transcriptional regulator [Neorhizobium galegae]